MRPLRVPLLLLALLLLPATDAQAFSLIGNPNNFSDICPDQPGDPPALATLGLNVALESFTCFGFGCQDNFDSFRFEVPAGLEITQTELLVLNSDGTAEQLWIFPAGVFVAPPTSEQAPNGGTDWQAGALFGLTDNNNTINGLDPNVSTFVLGPGVYDAVPWNFVWIGGGGWEATFTATVIPEPATAALLLAGLAPLGMRSRAGRG